MKLSKPTRGRIRAVVMLLALIGLAFVTWWGDRRYGWLPGGVKETAGNLLWAAAVFCLIAMLRPHWSTQALALTTLAVAWGMEATQLYRGWPLDVVRETAVGRAVIGSQFSATDMIAQAVGVVLASGMDVVVRPPVKGRRR